MSSQAVRIRYAPSPTGDPHLGNLRTAVYDYLFAKNMDGVFMVRLEDTDQTRIVEGSIENILRSLQWLGIEVDEGVYLDQQGKIAEKGDFGPYIQSHRLSIYKEYAQKLLDADKAYRCFCSQERLAQMREEQQKNHKPPRYDGLCRHISKEESEKRALAGESYVIRQKIPTNRQIKFVDLIRGEIIFSSNELDDQVLLKSDGFPTYQLANVVDDHLMQISHVFRGEEWIPSTPKNILLYEDLAWTPPKYAHLPLILGPDKAKLAKRHGAEPVLEYQKRGYLPEAILNILAFLGWSPGTEEEFFTKEELIARFSIERVQKGAAIFNIDRLDYVNGWYIRRLSVGELLTNMKPYLFEAGYIDKHEMAAPVGEGVSHRDKFLLAIAEAVQQRIKHFDETIPLTHFFFDRPVVDFAFCVPKKGDPDKTKLILRELVKMLAGLETMEWERTKLEALIYIFIEAGGYKNMEVLWPIRAALTGEVASPGAFEMLSVLGKEESLARLAAVVK